jgi:heparinase II/III-like protein
VSESPRPLAPVRAVTELWRSQAFAPTEPSPHLRRLHADDVLEAARRGDAREAARLLATWLDAHPYGRGEAWQRGALSARVANWVAATTLVPELATDEVSRSAWEQLLRLRRRAGRDVEHARGLVLGGVALGAPEIARKGIDLVRRALDESLLQRTPARQVLVLRDLLEIQAASPHAWLGDAIGRMRAFAAAVQRPDGAPALFDEGTIDVPRLELPEPPAGVATFEESGFVVVRDGPLWLAVRCGRPQTHADALSLQLWWEGRPLLVDPGAGERSTGAHSTVTVDGRDQPRRPDVRLRYVRTGAIEGSVLLHGGIRHIRRVEWDAAAGDVLVLDALEGKGVHDVASRLCWAPITTAFGLEAVGEADLTTAPAFVVERLGERVEATATVARLHTRLPVELGWRLRLEQYHGRP